MPVRADRSRLILRPDPSRVFFRPFDMQNIDRVRRIVHHVLDMSPGDAAQATAVMHDRFSERHLRLDTFLMQRFEEVCGQIDFRDSIPRDKQLLIGAYFTLEYSLEAAALFNPSIVLHPDQSGVPDGSVRFVLSLRATGEGHVSSIVFRTGIIDAKGNITVHKPTPFVSAPYVHTNPGYEKKLFVRKLKELNIHSARVQKSMNLLPEFFTFEQLMITCIDDLRNIGGADPDAEKTADALLALARANYEISFDPSEHYSERVIFPIAPSEARGIEDARFVRFCDDDGSFTYYATYTAFDGQATLPQLLETKDFVTFKASTLNGPQVQNKGMALFPRKVNGHFAMLGRQDGENIYLMYSDMLHFWYERRLVVTPQLPWEFVQLGNCGSPIETDSGWLVITHGVGPMRRYVIGAILLDRDNPERVIGRLGDPLLEPTPEEREGYVPNVLYSCGAIVHNGLLILPYAMSDQCSSFATVQLEELLHELTSNGRDQTK